MEMNVALELNPGNTRRLDRPGTLLRRRSSQSFAESEFQPKIEWVDNSDAYILVAELSGFKTKDDVKVQLDVYRNLTISGERRIEELVFAGGIWHPRKRPGYKFKKVNSVPDDVDTSAITARFEHEMLYVTCPKLKPVPEIRSIDIAEGQEQRSTPQGAENVAKLAESESVETKDAKSCQIPTAGAGHEKLDRQEDHGPKSGTAQDALQIRETIHTDEMAKQVDSGASPAQSESSKQEQAEVKLPHQNQPELVQKCADDDKDLMQDPAHKSIVSRVEELEEETRFHEDLDVEEEEKKQNRAPSSICLSIVSRRRVRDLSAIIVFPLGLYITCMVLILISWFLD